MKRFAKCRKTSTQKQYKLKGNTFTVEDALEWPHVVHVHLCTRILQDTVNNLDSHGSHFETIRKDGYKIMPKSSSLNYRHILMYLELLLQYENLTCISHVSGPRHGLICRLWFILWSRPWSTPPIMVQTMVYSIHSGPEHDPLNPFWSRSCSIWIRSVLVVILVPCFRYVEFPCLL